jgi:hypothetical protein
VTLHQLNADECSAECSRCHRRSPTLQATGNEAERVLSDLGWMKSTGDWVCPICHRGRSGEYRKIER